MLRKVVLLAVMLASNLRGPTLKPEPTERVVKQTSRTGGHTKGIGRNIGRAYERCLELPVQVVLALLWLVGAALIGLLLATFYPSYWLA